MPILHFRLSSNVLTLTSLSGPGPTGFPRFTKENFPINLKLVDALKGLAAKRGIPASQLAIAYVLKLSPNLIAIPGSSNKVRVLESEYRLRAREAIATRG